MANTVCGCTNCLPLPGSTCKSSNTVTTPSIPVAMRHAPLTASPETLLGASTIPLTMLVDANGRIVDKIYGAREWDSPESMQLIANALHWRKAASAR